MLNKIKEFKKMLENDFLNLLQHYKKEYNDFFFNMSIKRTNYEFGYFPACYDFNHFKINNFFKDKELNDLIKIIYTKNNEENFNIKVCFELNELLSIKFENTLSVLIYETNISCNESCIHNHHFLLEKNSLEECLKKILNEKEHQEKIKESFDLMIQNYIKSKNVDWKLELQKYVKEPVFNRKEYNIFLIDTKIIRYLNKKSFLHFKSENYY